MNRVQHPARTCFAVSTFQSEKWTQQNRALPRGTGLSVWQGAVAAVLKQADVLAELDQLQPREHTSTLQRSYLEVKPCSL